MKRHIRWLNNELREWVSAGIIKSEQAEVIRKRYPDDMSGLPWGAIIFSSIGGVVLGLGVILLFAYNWDVIPRFWKLAIIFGVLIIAHSAGILLQTRTDRFKALGESLNLLGTMLFGAGIWLIAQIYHIEEHFPNAFIIWALGALAMAWALPSIVQGILAAVLIAIWCGSESVAFDNSMHVGPLIIVVLLGSLAYVKRSIVLLTVLIPAFMASLLFVQAGRYFESGLLFGTALNVAVLLVALGILARKYGGFTESSPVFLFFGWIASVIVLYVLTFPDAAEHLLKYNHEKPFVACTAYWAGSAVLCLIGWGALAYMSFARKQNLGITADDYLLPLTVILGLVYMFFKGGLDGWAISGPFNLVLLALVVAMMVRGCRHGLLQPTIVGSVLLMIYMITRYFDLFHSLLVRGLVFIVAGVLIFGQGILYSRAKSRKVEQK
ncbi:MAG: DUF2157 domain-containing protein [Kiritimatiellae bacterium]|nr:DUF2157 domain-containing protein [Kiritimatiellia bacterium]MDD5523201.1 DUF2157 domain-containing protein [Kiritimatiellia bacterium]